MSSRNLLYFLADEYYNYYGNVDRGNCLSDVSNALSIYKSYKFNFEIYQELLKKVKKSQEAIQNAVLKESVFVCED